MKGVIYARFSCDNQHEESIEGQLRECKEFAKRNDIDIIGEYIDRAKSATTDRRPDFQRMIAESSKGAFEVIIVWKLDRFARNRYDSAHYKAQLRKNGVKVISATESISEGAEGVLLESVLEGMAEYYSKELGEKTLRGMRENAYNCKYNGGPVPFGYYIDEDKKHQPDPNTAPLVTEMFKMYDEGESIVEIVNDMKNRGVLANKGKPLSLNTITTMLHNRKYIGEYRFKDIIVPDGMPALVDKELFERVQMKLDKNKKSAARYRADDEYLLTTKLFCGHCGSMIYGESGRSRTHGKYRYYKCSNAKKNRGCKKKTVKKEYLEDAVINHIITLINNDETVNDMVEAVMSQQGKDNVVMKSLQKQLADVESGIENMLNAIQMGIFNESTKKRLDELEQRRNELVIDIGKEGLAHPVLSADDIRDFIISYRKLNVNKLEHKRRLIYSFVNKIYLYDDRYVITFNYNNGTDEVPLSAIDDSGILSGTTCNGEPKRYAKAYLFFFCKIREPTTK